MVKMKDAWKKHTEHFSSYSIFRATKNPAEFQIELANILDALCSQDSSVLEPGCEQATVSLILKVPKNLVLLDINDDIIFKLKGCIADNLQGSQVAAYHADMFRMPFSDECFDLVHNSGVIEHFSKQDRRAALQEYARVTKKGGYVVIAVPNHHSLPYRSAYLFHNYVLMRLFWKWPKEYKIGELSADATETNLQFEKRLCLAKDTTFRFWRPVNFVSRMLRRLDRIFDFPGYLEVYIFRKR